MSHVRYAFPVLASVLLAGAGGLVAGEKQAPSGAGFDCPSRPRSVESRTVSTDADSVLSVSAGDLDGDFRTDLVSASIGDSTIAWYRNEGGDPPTFTERALTTDASSPRSVYVIDVNGDGDIDVLAATGFDDSVAWWENDGAKIPGFTRRVITDQADNVRSVFGIDLDADDDVDVLSASTSDGTVAWYENSGGESPTFTRRVITDAAPGALTVFALDVDADLDVDVVAGYRGIVEWYENDGNQPPSFTTHLVTDTLSFVSQVSGADLDGDGDGDILSASQFDDTIAWYDNDGGDPPAFTKRVIDAAADLAVAVTFGDLDGDTRPDVVGANQNGDEVSWYQNDGGLPPTFMKFKVTTDLNGPQSIGVADVDGDLDDDVYSGSIDDDQIAWHEFQEPAFGACCLSDTSCVDDLCLADCAAVLAWRWAPDVSCADVTCPGMDAPALFLVEQLDFDNFQQVVSDLAAFETRYWDRQGNELATQYLVDKLESFGYDNVVLDPYTFQDVTKHNVYATKIGTVRPTEMYILGAHFDSFNINGLFDNAPGADDDASGCSSVLDMARVFASVDTDVSVRFVLWNNEETGLDGSRAYVENHRDRQGTMDEPTWLAMIQQDMIMFDRGPGNPPDADVEYQASDDADGEAIILGSFVVGAMSRYGDIPAELSGNMRNTDSVPFMSETVAISARENTRDEIGDGSNPHWHQITDRPETYTEQDYLHGFNICKMIAGAVGELVNARPAACPEDLDGSGAVDFGDILAILTAWGNPGGPEDLDGSGVVDFGDILAILTAWGPCA